MAVLVCYREHHETGCISTECTLWPTLDDARQAEAELTPCDPDCIGVHSIVPIQFEPGSRAASRAGDPSHGRGREKPL